MLEVGGTFASIMTRPVVTGSAEVRRALRGRWRIENHVV